jgi:hypothetical protein
VLRESGKKGVRAGSSACLQATCTAGRKARRRTVGGEHPRASGAREDFASDRQIVAAMLSVIVDTMNMCACGERNSTRTRS